MQAFGTPEWWASMQWMKIWSAPMGNHGGSSEALNTTDLTGELEDRHYIVSRGDSRLQMTIAITDKTTIFDRTHRFLIDDPGSKRMMAYTLSKPFKLGGSFNGDGVYKFVLQEVQSTDDDNHTLRIADYYKYFPNDVSVDPGSPEVINPDVTDEYGRRVWL